MVLIKSWIIDTCNAMLVTTALYYTVNIQILIMEDLMQHSQKKPPTIRASFYQIVHVSLYTKKRK